MTGTTLPGMPGMGMSAAFNKYQPALPQMPNPLSNGPSMGGMGGGMMSAGPGAPNSKGSAQVPGIQAAMAKRGSDNILDFWAKRSSQGQLKQSFDFSSMANDAIQSSTGQGILSAGAGLYNSLPSQMRDGIGAKAMEMGGLNDQNATNWQMPGYTQDPSQGVGVKGNTTVRNDELTKDRTMTMTPGHAGSPISQLFRGAMTGQMPKRTFPQGTPVANKLVVNQDQISQDKLVPQKQYDRKFGMGKAGSQDNSAQRLSSAGESSGVKFKHDDDGHATGSSAFDTLDGYMKKAGLNSFQTQFFTRMIESGMPDVMLPSVIKTAGDRFGAEVRAELQAGFEKIAKKPWWKQILPAAGRGLGGLKDYAFGAARRVGGDIAEASPGISRIQAAAKKGTRKAQATQQKAVEAARNPATNRSTKLHREAARLANMPSMPNRVAATAGQTMKEVGKLAVPNTGSAVTGGVNAVVNPHTGFATNPDLYFDAEGFFDPLAIGTNLGVNMAGAKNRYTGSMMRRGLSGQSAAPLINAGVNAVTGKPLTENLGTAMDVGYNTGALSKLVSSKSPTPNDLRNKAIKVLGGKPPRIPQKNMNRGIGNMPILGDLPRGPAENWKDVLKPDGILDPLNLGEYAVNTGLRSAGLASRQLTTAAKTLIDKYPKTLVGAGGTALAGGGYAAGQQSGAPPAPAGGLGPSVADPGTPPASPTPEAANPFNTRPPSWQESQELSTADPGTPPASPTPEAANPFNTRPPSWQESQELSTADPSTPPAVPEGGLGGDVPDPRAETAAVPAGLEEADAIGSELDRPAVDEKVKDAVSTPGGKKAFDEQTTVEAEKLKETPEGQSFLQAVDDFGGDVYSAIESTFDKPTADWLNENKGWLIAVGLGMGGGALMGGAPGAILGGLGMPMAFMLAQTLGLDTAVMEAVAPLFADPIQDDPNAASAGAAAGAAAGASAAAPGAAAAGAAAGPAQAQAPAPGPAQAPATGPAQAPATGAPRSELKANALPGYIDTNGDGKLSETERQNASTGEGLSRVINGYAADTSPNKLSQAQARYKSDEAFKADIDNALTAPLFGIPMSPRTIAKIKNITPEEAEQLQQMAREIKGQQQ